MAEIGAATHVGKLAAEGGVALAGGERKAFLVGAVKTAVFVLMDYAAPVGKVEAGGE